MMLTKEAILTAALPCEDVPVPEWGGTVRVQTLTGTQRDAFDASLATRPGAAGPDLSNIRARLAALCMVSEDGVRLFTDAEAAALGATSAAALDRVFTVAQRLNGLGQQAVEAAKGN